MPVATAFSTAAMWRIPLVIVTPLMAGYSCDAVFVLSDVVAGLLLFAQVPNCEVFGIFLSQCWCYCIM